MANTGSRNDTIRKVRKYGYINVKNLLILSATVLPCCYLVLFCALKLQTYEQAVVKTCE